MIEDLSEETLIKVLLELEKGPFTSLTLKVNSLYIRADKVQGAFEAGLMPYCPLPNDYFWR